MKTTTLTSLYLRFSLLFSGLFLFASFTYASVPVEIQVSGITSPLGANGVYELQGTMQANTGGTANAYNYSYWRLTSGSKTYYLYFHQYSTGSYAWNIDDDTDDTDNVLFFSAYYAADANNAPENAPDSPVGLSSWTQDVGVGTPSLSVASYSPIIGGVTASNVTSTSAMITINISDVGYPASNITYGVEWKVDGSRVFTNQLSGGSTSSAGNFQVSVTGLSANTTYYLMAYATNSVGTTYSDPVNFTTQVAAGLNDVSSSSFALYPTRVTEGFNVNAGEEAVNVSLYSISGTLMLSKQVQGQAYINASMLPSGVYVVKILSSNGLLTQKVIKD